MRNFAIGIFFIISSIILINSLPEEELASVKNINGEMVILFNKACEYSSISLSDENDKNTVSVIFSESMGMGPTFHKNTYLPIIRTFKNPLKENGKYQLWMVTDCLGNKQIPVYKIKFENSNGILKGEIKE